MPQIVLPQRMCGINYRSQEMVRRYNEDTLAALGTEILL